MISYLALAVAPAYMAAAAFFPALNLNSWKRRGVLVLLCLLILLSPLLLPVEQSLLRFVASMTAVTLLFKLYDLHLGARKGFCPSLRSFFVFLPNYFALVHRKLDGEPRPSHGENIRRLSQALPRLVLGMTVFTAMFYVDWQPFPFLIEHIAKVVTYFLMLFPAADVIVSLWRLMGGVTLNYMDNPLVAPTPAEFWRRYNRPAGQFYYENVFKQFGGLRAPVRATVLIFVISALIHEYLFGIAVGRFQGYQLMFFFLQGVGVVATFSLRPKRLLPLWTAATLAFNLLTAVFFFASLNGLVAFYSRPLPAWLAW